MKHAEKYILYMGYRNLTGLVLAESVGYEGLIFLVLLGIRGNLEGALKHERSAGLRGGGRR